MPVLSSAEMTEFRTLNVELAFHDAYRVQRPTDVSDGRGGRTRTWIAIESGMGSLERSGLRGETQAVAERLGWTSHRVIDLPFDTVATPKDRIEIDGRLFVIGEILRAGALEMVTTAISQEQG